jgi:hypothetical protein
MDPKQGWPLPKGIESGSQVAITDVEQIERAETRYREHVTAVARGGIQGSAMIHGLSGVF